MNDRGHAGIELALAVAVMLIPVAVVVTGFGPWSEARVLAESAAAESARAVALDLDHGSGVEVVNAIATNAGIESGLVRLGWCAESTGPLDSPAGACPLVRGGTIEARVEIWAPLIGTPWGDIGGLWVTADHSEPIDLYRSFG